MAPKISYPGVYIAEVASSARSIEGVSTSVTGFIGTARKGTTTKAVRVQSFLAFVRVFGALRHDSELGFAVRQFFMNGGQEAWVVRVQKSVSRVTIGKALRLLDAAETINLLVLPGVTTLSVLSRAEEYCRDRRAFLITDSPASAATVARMLQASRTGAVLRSPNAAVYFPWINIDDPSTRKQRVTAPSGTTAGLFASSDAAHGIWKAPAGRTASLHGITTLTCDISENDARELHASNVNTLREFPGIGHVAWSSRTTQADGGSNPEWKYVNVRRFVLYLEESIDRGTQWAVFEANDETLWARLRGMVANFLHDVWRQGALMGRKPEEAFFVKCGLDTMTQDDIANGRLIIQIGVALLKPAEFVILRVGQSVKGSDQEH